ncbi:L-serine ammonia-lyase, iron-sulfur-dependent, subunit alpha [Lutispora sp.]|nr:L-serine ammonia-lyase, iron-sulfur-dependent, subunit alpha [Lutispora sp.]MEA4960554.1 L-serine ammonia-lyase, iron-sulfur-dependent, subunit alpha [Lutispora sp.]HCJ57329.1 L-serine ammonia-lyase, iron-sulfur-dependent, subunit alpha [Clostridiaceae bacterium]
MSLYTMQQIIEAAEQKGVKISDIALEIESKESGLSAEEIKKRMYCNYAVMKDSVSNGINKAIPSVSGLTGGEGYRLWQERGKGLSGETILSAASRAMAVSNVNASMGKIVAAPTAGSCGIIPGVLMTVGERLGKSDEEIAESLITTAVVGKIIAQNATLAGAEGGCQAECGAASAMAAAAAVQLSGGTPSQAGDAAAIAMKGVMGLVCDPVAGLVEVPCIKRNSFGAAQAILAADMAMSGIKSVIPVDEVIKAMGEVGHAMPVELRETSMGGLAATNTGKMLEEKLMKKG